METEKFSYSGEVFVVDGEDLSSHICLMTASIVQELEDDDRVKGRLDVNDIRDIEGSHSESNEIMIQTTNNRIFRLRRRARALQPPLHRLATFTERTECVASSDNSSESRRLQDTLLLAIQESRNSQNTQVSELV